MVDPEPLMRRWACTRNRIWDGSGPDLDRECYGEKNLLFFFRLSWGPWVGTNVESDSDPFTYWGQNKDPKPVFNGSEPPGNGTIGDPFTSLPLTQPHILSPVALTSVNKAMEYGYSSRVAGSF